MTAPSAVATFRLRLLGQPSLVDSAGKTPVGLGWGKPLALLCYLVMRREVSRDEVVDLLWRDIDETKARNAFRQALHRLRTALGEQLVPHDRDALRLAPDSSALQIDVLEFENLARAGRHAAAIELYSGDFLGGSQLGEPAFDQWAEQQASRLRGEFRQALHHAQLEASRKGEWSDAIAYARRLHVLTPFDADAAKLAATTLVSAGRRLEAVALLRQFADRLQRELGAPVPGDVEAMLARASKQVEFAVVAPETATPQLPFVGREADLSQLLALWQSVLEDAGAFALVEGDAGIGRTRLVRELVGHARALRPAAVLTAYERGAVQVAYGVFAEALRPLVRAPGVAGASAHLLAEAARLLPELRDQFDLPPNASVDDEAARLRFFEGIAALIEAAAYEQPLLIVLEDLHNAPASSLDLLAYLGARLRRTAVMFVVTARSDASSAATTRLRSMIASSGETVVERVRHLALSPLSAMELTQAARDRARSVALDDRTLDRIVRWSAGNPSRLDTWLTVAAAGDVPPESMASLRDVLRERIERLSSVQRRVFLVLALLRRPGTASLLAAAAHVSETSCHDALVALRHTGVVTGRDDMFIADEGAALLALELAGGSGRAFVCGWIADALAEMDAPTEELASFYAAAGDASHAFSYARQAAFDALAVGAVSEASQFLSVARTFATTTEQASQIEGVLSGLGAGRKRLGGISRTPSEVVDDTRPDPRDRPSTFELPWSRWFPHWRALLGAAIATLIIATAVLATRRTDTLGADTRAADSLVIVSDVTNGPGSKRIAIGDPRSGFIVSRAVDRVSGDVSWVDSLPRRWENRLPDSRGVRAAATLTGPSGVTLYVLNGSPADTVPLVRDRAAIAPLAWSPDGAWLLFSAASRGARADAGVGLFALRLDRPTAILPIDTTADHSVTEAQWSPSGPRIAWVARVGDERQLEVFASLADGAGVRDVSRDPADDYHIAWSPDGDLLAFTSTRDGNAELYAVDLLENKLWRLTSSPSVDDHATFAPDGRTLAFESTRGGAFNVYVMPALGGSARLVAEGRVARWLSGRPGFIDRVRVDAAGVGVGDSTRIEVRAYSSAGERVQAHDVEWRLLDPAQARFASRDTSGAAVLLYGVRPGLARLVATVGHWKTDTAFVRVGSDPVRLLDLGMTGRERWRWFAGASLSSGALVFQPRHDGEMGILSASTLPLSPGLTLSATVAAPWVATAPEGTEAAIAFVLPEDTPDAQPPFVRLASITWKGSAQRVVYTVGSEAFSEVPRSFPDSVQFVVRVERDSTVSFMANGAVRWRSSVRIVTPQTASRAQLWIAGRGAADRVRVSSVSAVLNPPDRGASAAANRN